MKFEPINKLLLVNRKKFRITLYERPENTYKFKVLLRYDCAVGADGYDTPGGLYLINTRVKYPDWLVPNTDWAIELGLTPGTIIKGGMEENPLKERWLGVTDPAEGVGIHGTSSYWSIGTRASHGCIRMLPEDIIELYDAVPKYTPIVIL